MKQLLTLVSTLLLALIATAQDGGRLRTEPWPQAVLDLAARLPIQEGGRIKPLHTFAGFQMQRLNGKRGLKTASGERLTPVAWVLDCMFFPEQARDYEVVEINDYKVVESIGLPHSGKRRKDRYSYAQLEPGFGALSRQSQHIGEKEAGLRSSREKQILRLSHKLTELRLLLSSMDFARLEQRVGNVTELAELFPEAETVNAVQLAAAGRSLRAKMRSLEDAKRGPLVDVMMAVNQASRQSVYLDILPPADAGEEQWLSPGSVLSAMNAGHAISAKQVAILGQLTELAVKRTDIAAFTEVFGALHGNLVQQAAARNEGGDIGMEVSFYEADLFWNSIYVFLFGFLFCVALWFMPRSKLLYCSAWAVAGAAELMVIAGIVWRCVLRGRPPVTTVYEAVLFIVASMVLVVLFVEALRRNRLALSLSTIVGCLGLLLAGWQEGLEERDTMGMMQAVLDTNFWLAVHVPTITLGYMAGLLAAVFAHLYIFAKLFNLCPGDQAFYKDIGRMTYGVLAFGLVCSLIGTILGGVWANESWGRFWGWDPKENGALMLCLALLLILHLRLSGYLRDLGIAIASMFVAVIVIWAFWGVNLYQVGLHSYGFDENKALAAKIGYWWFYSWMGLGGLAWLIPRLRTAGAVGGASAGE